MQRSGKIQSNKFRLNKIKNNGKATMKKKVYLFSIFISACCANYNVKNLLWIAGKDAIKIYTDSPTTEKFGYDNPDPLRDGEYLMIQHFIKPGDTVIDAGAHIGDWSELVLRHTNKHCHLYSFEPVPHFFSQLTQKHGSSIRAYNVALGNINGSTGMNYYYQKETEGCSSLFDRKVLGSIPTKKITIQVTRLDTFCNNNRIDRINFLKIDTEGSEWDVLQGANSLITNGKIDIVQFEYGGTYPDANITLQQVYTYLTQQGYVIFRIAPDGLIHIPQWRDALENNHFSNYIAFLNRSSSNNNVRQDTIST